MVSNIFFRSIKIVTSKNLFIIDFIKNQVIENKKTVAKGLSTDGFLKTTKIKPDKIRYQIIISIPANSLPIFPVA